MLSDCCERRNLLAIERAYARGLGRRIPGGMRRDGGGGTSAAPAPVPGDFANLFLHWRGDVGVTTTAGPGSNVTAWLDSVSAQSLAQGTGSAMPVHEPTSDGNMNSQPSARWESGDVMQVAGGSVADWKWIHDGTTDWTLIHVMRAPTATASWLFLTGSTAATGHGLHVEYLATNEIHATLGNGGPGWYGDVTTSTSGAFDVTDRWYAIRYRAGNDLRITYSGGTATAALVGAPSSTNPSYKPLVYGANTYEPEILWYKQSLADADLASLVSGYLNPLYLVAA